jgi:hypothetical protein
MAIHFVFEKTSKARLDSPPLPMIRVCRASMIQLGEQRPQLTFRENLEG